MKGLCVGLSRGRGWSGTVNFSMRGNGDMNKSTAMQRISSIQGFARQLPEAHVEMITPELAKEMLQTSVGNRRMRGWYVALLAAAMRRGEWRVTSNGIGFDVNGRLKDAHHRLNACVQAGVAFPSVVVFGMREDAYEVIDTGILRTYADRLDMPGNVADALRLGCVIALSTTKPTIDEMRPIIDSGLGDALSAIVEFCGTKRRYYSSAPMKLAAAITVMNGGSADFVLSQYRALCTLDFDEMSKSAHSLVRQVDSGMTLANNTRDVLARGFRVFDKSCKDMSKIQINEVHLDKAYEFVRYSLRNRASKVSG